MEGGIAADQDLAGSDGCGTETGMSAGRRGVGLGIVILRRRDEAVPEALQRVSLRDLVTLPGTESGVTQLARHRAG